MSTVPHEVPAFATLGDARCVSHGDRPAVALCRQCLDPRCGECLVKVDGVNHCATCLRELFPPPPPRPPRRSFPGAGLLRAGATIAAYSLVALIAASAGVAMPFFANERNLTANRQRVTEVHLAVSAYFSDVGTYPEASRGLAALLAPGPEDRERWRGPYLTARAAQGRAARVPADEGKVLDVFGRPVFYWASISEDDEDGLADLVYVASPGANGTYETPGVRDGRAPRDESGDDVVQWVVWT